ncbi:MAG: hypothetical protein MK066_02880 [Crocinitomicaceae bacterium]|nr:hypothetical protein [Crocinitomicaceae bacterium]
MFILWRNLLFLLLLGCTTEANAQYSSLRIKTVKVADTIFLDTLSILPTSMEVHCNSRLLGEKDYSLDFTRARLFLHTTCSDSLKVRYRVLPMNLIQAYVKHDTSLIFTKERGFRERFLISGTSTNSDFFGGSSLNKSGSISRGISFGNNQDLGVNSTLNLQLSGQIAPNLKLLASVSDDNLPIQPDGNTNKLREFDQVFIQVYNDQLKLIAGDFWLKKPEGYFMAYKKRAQGLTMNYEWRKDSTRLWKTQASGALSKGKFQRQIIQGVEGNQGPYRLKGSQNEPFIIILSGTERVYIDGRQLDRGQEFDYVIDYNTGEVTFTSRNQITKDSRIVLEFQYSDQNYARSLLQSATSYRSKKMRFWLNAYSEQDAKNQTLQQELSLSQKSLLSSIGDTIDLARTSSIDSIGYFENQNLYKLVSLAGNDSVLVYSVNPDSALYRATFEFVGAGKGDYIFSNYNALGKVYVWVDPVAGVSQGDYQPSRLIITPQQRQMVTSGVNIQLRKGLHFETEWAYSKNDKNTFSNRDREDDQSVGGIAKLMGEIPLSRDSIPKWKLKTKAEIEVRDRNFTPIEQYRSVEFDRDWNTRNKGYVGNQIASKLGANFVHRKNGNLNIEGQQYLIGEDYSGLRAKGTGSWKANGFTANWNGSYLSSEAERKNEFIRHRSEVTQQLGWIKIGYKDDHELNRFNSGILEPNSYQFFDYQLFVANGDSIKNSYKLFFRERFDRRSDSISLVDVAKARSVGGELSFNEWKNQRLTVITSYRELRITNSSLINQAPENTLLGRIQYEFKLWKSALTFNSFYEVGSGLELKKEFQYIQVNDGQGVYTWIDYNNDGIKDLNEFEIALFADQASYIRVFTPSNEYVKTYSNEFNQSIYWRPKRIWGQKKGVLKIISMFSDQARVRINRKTNYFDGNEAFNPFYAEIDDVNLLATNSNIRNTVFFNRTSSIFNANYIYQNVQGKTLLASGFDSKLNRFHEVSMRLNLMRKFTLELSGKVGDRHSEADYTSGRDYRLAYGVVEPSIIYQPSTVFRLTLDGRVSEKKNDSLLGGEIAKVLELGTTLKYNQLKKGSLQGGIKIVQIAYDGIANSALGFEMLEGLKPGVNYTWNVSYQRSISKSLQLSIQYNGRKSEENRPIHSGGMEVRAFF